MVQAPVAPPPTTTEDPTMVQAPVAPPPTTTEPDDIDLDDLETLTAPEQPEDEVKALDPHQPIGTQLAFRYLEARTDFQEASQRIVATKDEARAYMEERGLDEMSYNGVEMKFVEYQRSKIDKTQMEADGVLEKYTVLEDVRRFSMKAVKETSRFSMKAVKETSIDSDSE